MHITDAAKALLLFLLLSLPSGPECDVKQIAFVGHDGNDNEIFVINPDGSGLKKLTNNNHGDTNPVWSCKGDWIAFNGDGNIFAAGTRRFPKTAR